MAEPVGVNSAAASTLTLGNCTIEAPSPAVLQPVVAAARALEPWLVAERREYHRCAELGWQETRTSARIVATLGELGYEVVAGADFLKDTVRLGLGGHRSDGVGDTGCVATFSCSRPGPTVCVRADIDALPITEAGRDHRPADEGWASETPGVMHACGHDGHIVIGLGVARLLRPLLERGHGRLRLIFQPAEEGGRGARSVVDAGWLNDVDVFLGYHIGLEVPSGTVALDVTGFLATRKFKVILTGAPAHAGKAPQTGRNALLAACQAVLGLHVLAQSSEPGVRLNVGTLRAGRSLNIVPDEAELRFEIRAMSQGELDRLTGRVTTLLEGTAAAHQVDFSLELIGEAGDWRNDVCLVQFAHTVCTAGGIFLQHRLNHEFGASEDATLMAKAVANRGGAAAIFVLGANLASGHHTPTFDFDEAVLPEGVALIASLAAATLDALPE